MAGFASQPWQWPQQAPAFFAAVLPQSVQHFALALAQQSEQHLHAAFTTCLTALQQAQQADDVLALLQQPFSEQQPAVVFFSLQQAHSPLQQAQHLSLLSSVEQQLDFAQQLDFSQHVDFVQQLDFSQHVDFAQHFVFGAVHSLGHAVAGMSAAQGPGPLMQPMPGHAAAQPPGTPPHTPGQDGQDD